MKTHEVNAAIRRAYPSTEYAVMFEVGNATGSRVTRHADAVVMNLWPSRGLLIEGIEVKVSRSDWTREIKNPEKAEAISKYCDKWWIIAPEGIVHEHEVPALWGYKKVNAKGALVTVKDAPKKDKEELHPLDRGFVSAMLRRASEADSRVVDKLVATQVAKERASIKDQVDREVARQAGVYAKVEERLAKLKEMGLHLDGHWSDVHEIMRAYKLGKSLRDSYELSGLNHKADALIGVAETLKTVHATLFAEESVK